MDIFTNLLIAIGLGVSAGALSAFVGWNKSGEPFDARKFVSGLITGVIAGLVFVVGIASQITEAVDQTALLLVYIAIFVGIVGVDNLRTGVSASITKQESNTQPEPSA